MEMIEFREHNLLYQQSGGGPAVLLIHGFCEDHSIWEDLIALLEPSYQVISLDLPGFGNSSPVDKPTIKYFADAAKAVLDELGIERAVVIGHSMGGYVGLAFAEKYPDMVEGLGLYHSHPYADTQEKKEARQKSAEFIERSGAAPFVKQLIPTLFAPAFAHKNPEIVQKLVNRAAKFQAYGIQGGLQAMRKRPDRSEVLEEANFPVLFIIGGQDAAIPHENSMEQTKLPEVSSVHLYEEVGHMGMFEAPQETGAAVQEFLQYIYG